MRHYELVCVLKPTLSEEELNARVEAIQNLIKENQGEIYNLEKWGRRNLAYPIQKFNSGYYYLINYKTDNSKLAGILEYNLRITEEVIRFLNMKIQVKEDKKEVA
ncbi:30S ribosomal protein S6 [Sulfurihydrogenibium subterraneum]|uniref:30S ribosomal protein S6 n=1 Tax=Sulfurihydrogenibium subterraneum TaxID=171121 RepID=UPI00048A7FA0|nr:30S ribosomal protein S6 [Sulfurihydrogenibium subterraneum]